MKGPGFQESQPAEAHAVGKERNAENEAYALILALREGAELDDVVLAHLRSTLIEYEARSNAQKAAARPVSSGARAHQPGHTAERPARQDPQVAPDRPAEAPVAPPVTEQREAWMERQPWNRFNNAVLLEEIRHLNEEERTWIEKMAHALAEETRAFRVVSGKAIGAKVRQYSHDYMCVDVKTSPDADFDWQKWMDYLQNALPAEFGLISRSYDLSRKHVNVISVTADNYLASAGMAVVSVHLQTPTYTAYVDDRPIMHDALLFVRSGVFTNAVRAGEHARLLPFVYQCAALEMQKQHVTFFDGSFAGKKRFGMAPNPLVATYDFPGDKIVFRVDDTSENGSPKRLTSSDVGVFMAHLNDSLGVSVPRESKTMQVGNPVSGDHRGQPFQRVKAEDRSFLESV